MSPGAYLPRRLVFLTSMALVGCGPGEGSDDAADDGASESGDTGGECQVGGDPANRLSCGRIQIWTDYAVDLLFVIDNSGSMGEEQAALVQSADALFDALEDPRAPADVRIGFTTTDNSNPWCGASTTPELGALVLSGCRAREEQFTNQQGTVDAFQLACANECPLSDAELAITPTTTERDPEPAPRPWFENTAGTTNLPASVRMRDAFRCFAPQGIDGCGFESPLESMFKTLVRANTDGDPAFGFLRDTSVVGIVHLTDETDCSYNDDWSIIFEAEGNRVFWDDPTDAFPTSAVCWNAGTACTPTDVGYDCVPADYDVDGNVLNGNANVDDAAVLHPVSRYANQLQGLENAHKELDPDIEFVVGLIGGVGPDGVPVYADIDDPAFMKDYGIGPGCEGVLADADQRAVPPVRLAAFVDAFSPGNLFSVCEPDYGPAMVAIGEQVRSQFRPSCYGECVADADPSTALLEPSCVVEQLVGAEAEAVPECLRDTSGAYEIDPQTGRHLMPDDDADLCYATRTDADATATPDVNDDMSQTCVEAGLNLEFMVARRVGVPRPAGSVVEASCELSPSPSTDCPGL